MMPSVMASQEENFGAPFQLCSAFQGGVIIIQAWKEVRSKINTLIQSTVFGQKREISISAKKDTIRKGTSRGAEQYNFQLHSSFQ